MINVFDTKLKEYLKLYYYIGGMPEVVSAYIENKDLLEVRKIQKTLLDVGLLSAMAGIDDKTLLEENEIFEEFKGSLTEQYVLCQLKQCTNLDIFYWSSDTGISEVDFITQIGRNNIPIEVKASENLQAKSLKTFVQKYNTKFNIRTSMSRYREEDWLINIPLYSIGNIEKIIK